MMRINFLAITLLYLLDNGGQYLAHESCAPNPCKYNPCKEYEFCWYDKKYRRYCEDPCSTIRCKAGYKCRADVGDCGSCACPPKACCSSPCEYAKCPAGTICYSNTKNCQPSCVNACPPKNQRPGYKCVTVPGPCQDYSCPPVPYYYSVCEDYPCYGPDEVCWFNGTGPECTNPCAYTDCLSTFTCRKNPDTPIGLPYPPIGQCYRKYPPSSCDGIKCPGKEKCSLVSTLEYPAVPICGPNPCINPPKPCCSVRTNNGKRCDDDGCYLQFQKGSCTKKGEPCCVEQVCLDPCKVEQVQCPVGTFCYKDQVECFAAPCNPVTTCRQPCNATYGSVCYPNQKCQVIYVSCAQNAPYCKPIETCINNCTCKN